MVEINKWLSAEFETFLSDSANLITEKIGAEHIKNISLIGSFATREGTLVSIDEKVVFLSDVDIIVVVDSLEVLKEALPIRRQIGKECEKLLGSRAVFVGRVDVGVMTLEDLSKLPPSPGNLLMKYRALVLFGDRGVFDAIPVHKSDTLPREEASRLLENRIVQFLPESKVRYSSLGERIEKYRYIYSVSKVYTDIAVVLVSLSGGYVAEYKRRYEYLKDNESIVQTNFHSSNQRLIDLIGWATDYKLSPSVDDELPFESVDDIWKGASKDLFAAWLSVKGFSGSIDDFLRDEKIDDYLMSKGSRGMSDNLRLWRSFFDRRGWDVAPRIFFERGFSLLSLSPFETIRNEAVRLLFGRIKNGEGFRPDKRAVGFPFGADSFEDAARELYANWHIEVHGG